MVELDGMLSIVMPAYNEEKLIYQSIMKTLDIVSGFVREIELIAVNDGSKDNTKAEILRAVRKDKRVTLRSRRIIICWRKMCIRSHPTVTVKELLL